MFDFPAMMLVAGLVVFLCSFVLFVNDRITPAVFMLFAASLTLFLFAASLDPFLNLWDERFHALVAKNLMNHPFRPTLYDDPVITMAYDRWDRSVVWLHKQPLFLWQIALSYKVFGFNEFAVRFPSALLGSLLVPVCYRSGKILVNPKTGYYAAVFAASSFYLFELISGHRGVDHNDAVFLFFVSASIWTWLEFIRSGKRYWIVLTGLFSGFAILTKWLPGMVVYAAWALYILTDRKIRSDRKACFQPAVALLVTCCIVLPWQFLILTRYPAEALAEYNYNTDHFFRVLEGCDEPWWFYFGNLPFVYGWLSVALIPAGMLLLFRKIRWGLNMKIAVSSLPLIVYLFFSLARTKMTSLPFFISMPVFIAMACAVDFLTESMSRFRPARHLSRIAVFTVLVIIFGVNLRTGELIRKHSLNITEDRCPGILVQNRNIFLRYRSQLPTRSVIFNLPGRSYVDCMFYSGCTAYNFLPTPAQYLELKSKAGYHIFLVNILKNECPDYLRNDEAVTVLNEVILCCD